MDNRYVALLDVLGFSALVGGDDYSTRLADYHRCVEKQFPYGAAHGVDYSAFSDSIVLTTKSDTDSELQAICGAVSKLFADLLTVDIAIRGAVAHGQVFRTASAESSFVAGKPVLEAFEFEKKQAWVGVMLAPSVTSRIVGVEGKLRTDLQDKNPKVPQLSMSLHLWSKIPMQASVQIEDFEGFAIVPIAAWLPPENIATSLFGSRERLARMRVMAPDPRTQAKYSRAIEFVTAVKKHYQGHKAEVYV